LSYAVNITVETQIAEVYRPFLYTKLCASKKKKKNEIIAEQAKKAYKRIGGRYPHIFKM